MRPTVTEQLDGLRRILSEIIAPEITSPYPAEILGGVIGALDALKSSWPAIPAFLRWDIAATEAVLAAARPLVADDLAADIQAMTDEGPAETLDWIGLEDRQMRVRALLVRAMPVIIAQSDKTDAYALMTRLFRERAERFPFSMAARPPAKTA